MSSILEIVLLFVLRKHLLFNCSYLFLEILDLVKLFMLELALPTPNVVSKNSISCIFAISSNISK